MSKMFEKNPMVNKDFKKRRVLAVIPDVNQVQRYQEVSRGVRSGGRAPSGTQQPGQNFLDHALRQLDQVGQGGRDLLLGQAGQNRDEEANVGIPAPVEVTELLHQRWRGPGFASQNVDYPRHQGLGALGTIFHQLQELGAVHGDVFDRRVQFPEGFQVWLTN